MVVPQQNIGRKIDQLKISVTRLQQYLSLLPIVNISKSQLFLREISMAYSMINYGEEPCLVKLREGVA